MTPTACPGWTSKLIMRNAACCSPGGRTVACCTSSFALGRGSAVLSGSGGTSVSRIASPFQPRRAA